MIETRSRKTAAYVSCLPEDTYIKITTTSEIQTYRRIATNSAAFRRKVRMLKINVARLTSSNVVELSSFLAYCQEIIWLSIDVQELSIAQCLRLFSTLRFPNLTGFSTKNLPHEGLHQFISRHSRISDITLGPCSRVRAHCALQSTRALQQLHEVRGEFKCISKLVSRATQRIFADVSTPDEFGYRDLFKRISEAGANVRLFSMEYIPSDTADVMSRLVNALPTVSTMRLVECIDEAVHPNGYPWNSLTWGRSLRKLRDLKRLHISTTDKLVGIPGNIQEEYQIILGWTKDTEKKHETLEEITLWYAIGEETSYMSFWWRRGYGQGYKWGRDLCIENREWENFSG